MVVKNHQRLHHFIWPLHYTAWPYDCSSTNFSFSSLPFSPSSLPPSLLLLPFLSLSFLPPPSPLQTSVCQNIMEQLGQANLDSHQKQVVMVSQDSFYKNLTEEQRECADAGEYNFDHPGQWRNRNTIGGLAWEAAIIQVSGGTEIRLGGWHERLRSSRYGVCVESLVQRKIGFSVWE